MSKNYYVFSSGRLKQHDKTLYFENDEERLPIPVEDVDELYVMGEVDLNTHLLNFISGKSIPMHVFNYYGFYSGTYYPRESHVAGALVVNQAEHYSDPEKRFFIAREFVLGAAHGIRRTITYYRRKTLRNIPPTSADDTDTEFDETSPDPDAKRTDGYSDEEEMADISNPPEECADNGAGEPRSDDPFAPILKEIDQLTRRVASMTPATSEGFEKGVEVLRGLEGNIRENYYRAWPLILRKDPDLTFEKRVRRPPDNIVNSMISYGNGMLYAACAGEIHHTPLNPSISYLHVPGARRLSLSFDIAEIFKPLIVDRLIFSMLNMNQMQAKHFQFSTEIVNGAERTICYLNPAGRKVFVKAYQEKLDTTIRHPSLKRNVSYQTLIRMECHKLAHHLCGSKRYSAFRAWW